MTPYPESFNWYTLRLVGSQQVRLVLVDLGVDRVVAIEIGADSSNWDSALAEAMPIVESLTYK